MSLFVVVLIVAVVSATCSCFKLLLVLNIQIFSTNLTTNRTKNNFDNVTCNICNFNSYTKNINCSKGSLQVNVLKIESDSVFYLLVSKLISNNFRCVSSSIKFFYFFLDFSTNLSTNRANCNFDSVICNICNYNSCSLNILNPN